MISAQDTRYTIGQVIKTKQPKEGIEVIESNWALSGPGWPCKGFFSNRSTELCNNLMKDYTAKLGISHKTTPSFSPWANVLCEQNHTTVDKQVVRIRQDYHKMTL